MSVARNRQWMMTACSLTLAACASTLQSDYYGTTEPFASEAVYFVLTDRFVDGDSSNNHSQQGGANRTFDRPLRGANGVPDNIGYLGGVAIYVTLWIVVGGGTLVVLQVGWIR